MKKQSVKTALVLSAALALCPRSAWAQDSNASQATPDSNAAKAAQAGNGPQAAPDSNGPAAPQQDNTAPQVVQKAANATEEFIRKFHIGGFVGVGLDPELLEFGGHPMWGPYFKNSLDFRPGVDVAIGELTTVFAINFDLLYRFPQAAQTRWTPYVGGGPNVTMMHKAFASQEELGNNINPTTRTTAVTTSTGTTVLTTTTENFDFSNTQWETGANVIVGARTRRGMFVEMRATVWGAQLVKVLAGFDF